MKDLKVVYKEFKKIPKFFSPIEGEIEENLITYIIKFEDEDAADEWDENEAETEVGSGYQESWGLYRLVQIIPYIANGDTDNPVLINQNNTLTALAQIELRKAYMWLFEQTNLE